MNICKKLRCLISLSVSIFLFWLCLSSINCTEQALTDNQTLEKKSALPLPTQTSTTNLVEELKKLIQTAQQYKLPTPGSYDTQITKIVAFLMPQVHYSQHPLNDEIAGRFFTNYITMLDPMRLHFLKTDIEQFELYNRSLDELVLEKGSLLPAYQIFSRYYSRLLQRVEYVASLLEKKDFILDAEEWYNPDRKNALWPKDLEEAKQLWKKHLKYEFLQERVAGASEEEALATLIRRYKRSLMLIGELDGEDILQFYLSALCQAFDPHSDYMGPAQLENFAINMKLSLFGIGALLRWEDGYCKVESLVPGGPAEKSGAIQPGDRIIAVQQEGEAPIEVIDMKLQKVVEMIRGPKGTKVTLHILPASTTDISQRKVVTLIRDEIKLTDQRAKAIIEDIISDNGQTNRIGIIDLPSFYAPVNLGTAISSEEQATKASSSEDMAKLLRKLQSVGVEGILLDLRKNGGGSLEEAIRTTGLFIKEGPIVQIRSMDGEIIVESDPDPSIVYEGPLVVLVSRFSASASEILAGALQDYKRAIIVGDSSTYGKGTVQTILELRRSRQFPPEINPGAIKVTIRKFYRPNGESTQLRGVVSDIVLPSINNVLEIGEKSRDYALAWDTIEPVQFTPLNIIDPVKDQLIKLSEGRRSHDPEFKYILEDITEYHQRKQRPEILLTLESQLKEKERLEQKRKQREEERKSRVQEKTTVYEIKITDVDLPGLPSPTQLDNIRTNLTITSSTDTSNNIPTSTVDVHLKEAKQVLLDWIRLVKFQNASLN